MERIIVHNRHFMTNEGNNFVNEAMYVGKQSIHIALISITSVDTYMRSVTTVESTVVAMAMIIMLASCQSGTNAWTQSTGKRAMSQSSHFHCYLLRSLDPKHSSKTYIGCTVSSSALESVVAELSF